MGLFIDRKRISWLIEDVVDLLNRVSELEEEVNRLNMEVKTLIGVSTKQEKNIDALWDQVELLQTKVKFSKETK